MLFLLLKCCLCCVCAWLFAYACIRESVWVYMHVYLSVRIFLSTWYFPFILSKSDVNCHTLIYRACVYWKPTYGHNIHMLITLYLMFLSLLEFSNNTQLFTAIFSNCTILLNVKALKTYFHFLNMYCKELARCL